MLHVCEPCWSRTSLFRVKSTLQNRFAKSSEEEARFERATRLRGYCFQDSRFRPLSHSSASDQGIEPQFSPPKGAVRPLDESEFYLIHKLVPLHGFEPRFRSSELRVLPLDDNGLLRFHLWTLSLYPEIETGGARKIRTCDTFVCIFSKDVD